MFDLSIPALQHQQSRFIAPGRGMLRNSFGWQGKIKISGPHRDHSITRRGQGKQGDNFRFGLVKIGL